MRVVTQVAVDAPPDVVFAFLSDIERVTRCLPGAELEGQDGAAWFGVMRVRVGPISAHYRGRLEFAQLDTAGRRAVIRARGQDTAGQGSAEAEIVTSVAAAAAGSVVDVEADLQVRGRVAQFGRGAIQRISERMFAEFATNLRSSLASDDTAPDPPAFRPFSRDGGGRLRRLLGRT